VTVDRSGVPAAQAPARGAPGALDPVLDLDPSIDEPWYSPSIADEITLSPSAAKRLAERARIRALVMSELEDARCSVDVGSGKSIVLDGGLYRAGRTR